MNTIITIPADNLLVFHPREREWSQYVVREEVEEWLSRLSDPYNVRWNNTTRVMYSLVDFSFYNPQEALLFKLAWGGR